jgi:microsomal dipeptidase-like Zn-dependent dipeptidase
LSTLQRRYFFRQANLGAIVADFDYLVEQAGPEHVALGSDFYGVTDAPAEPPDIAALPAPTDALARRGYADEVILNYNSRAQLGLHLR